MRIISVFPRISPRDIVRFAPLGQELAKHCDEFACIEIGQKPRSGYYQFTEYAGSQTPFRVVTLFPGESVGAVRRSGMRGRLFATLNDLSPSVVWTSGYSSLEAILSAEWSIRNGVPCVFSSVSKRSDKKRHPVSEALKRTIVACFDGALVGGTLGLEYAMNLGVRKERIVTGSNFADNESLARQAERSRDDHERTGRYELPARFLLYVGRLSPEKNLRALLRAYRLARSRCRNVCLPLVLVGDGVQRDDLVELAARLGLAGPVRFIGWCKADELVDYYVRASALILPSLTETWGLVVNEAMVCGLPVAVSDRCGCVPELVHPGRNGWLLDPTLMKHRAGTSGVMTAEIQDRSRWAAVANDCGGVARGVAQCTSPIRASASPGNHQV